MKKLLILITLFGCAHQGKLAKVCLEGQTYLNFEDKLALKVDDSGRPVKCICKNCEIEFAKKMDEQTKTLVSSALDWLKPLDSGNPQKNWDLSSFKFKTHMSRREWAKKQRGQYRALGKLKSRRPFAANISGTHATISFNADYEQQSHLQDIVHMVKEHGKWKGISFITK